MAAAPVEARTAQFQSLGMSPDVAKNVAEAVDDEMGRCILSLYRSAAQPTLAELGKEPSKAAAKPGLVVIATEDHYIGGEILAGRSAERAGAEVSMLDGLGHRWMCEDPKRGAEMLSGFLSGVS